VLEEGDYEIAIKSDAHNTIDTQTYHVASTITYDEGNARSTDQTAAVNAFDFAEGTVTYLSRADGFANYDEATAAPDSMSMADEFKSGFTMNYNWDVADHAETDAEMPTTSANNGTTVDDLVGKDYDDPLWDDLFDNLSIEEMQSMIALGGYQTTAAESVGKVATTDCDRPASINNNFTGVGSIGFPCGVVIANTWNEDLALAFGEKIGKMADEMNVSGWYAPAMNMHRNAFSGRNFEYYSEDPVLSGRIASQACQGSAEYGVYAYIKHFAMYEMETNRWGVPKQVILWQ
jgi:beta-glucosidase